MSEETDAKRKDVDEETAEPELVVSELDETTHSELRVLYKESSGAVLFAKAQQWWTVGSTLTFYVVLMLIAKFGEARILRVSSRSFSSSLEYPLTSMFSHRGMTLSSRGAAKISDRNSRPRARS